MDKYTLYCTEPQACKALELGAPIERFDVSSIEGRSIYNYPTAEQMIGWLEEQDIFININHIRAGYGSWIKTISTNENISENLGYVPTRKEAMLNAIDRSLEYLITRNNHGEIKSII